MRKTRNHKTSAITFSLRPDEARALRQYAKFSGVPINTAINLILKRWIEREEFRNVSQVS